MTVAPDAAPDPQARPVPPDAVAPAGAAAGGLVRAGWSLVGIRFLFVGVLNTLVGLTLYGGGLWLGLRPDIALAVSVVLGALNNFITTGGLVFRNRDPRLLWRFALAYAVMYAANALALDGLIWATGIHPLVAQCICVGPILCLNFLVLRKLVFARRAG